VLLGDDRLVIVKMLEHHAPEPKPLAQVHDAIVAAITREDESQAALKAAQAAREQLAGGASFDSVLQDLKVAADPAHFVGRRDPSIPPQIREAVFAMPRPAGKPEFRALALNDGGAAVVAVTALRTAPAADQKARLEAGTEEAQRQGANDVLAYEDEVRRTADVRKNPKAFE
jgi:peptidyl-prolyl cis-trans isomerase D